MTPGAARRPGRIGRWAGAALVPLLIGLLPLAAACLTPPSPAQPVPPAGRLFIPLVHVPLALPGVEPTPYAQVRINRILQDGPENQILELINHGTGSQRLVDWTISFEDGPRIFRFTAGSLPPFEGKAWVTTSQASNLSVYSLGYYPHEAGRRFLPGGIVLLKDDKDRLVDRYVIREVPPADAPEPTPTPTLTPTPTPVPAATPALTPDATPTLAPSPPAGTPSPPAGA